MKMDFKNSKRMGIVIGIILFIALISGVTYAWLSYTSNSMPVADGTTHCFNINYSNGGNITGKVGIINEIDFLTSDTISFDPTMAFTSLSLELDGSCNLIEGIGTIELNVDSLDSFFTTTELNPLMYVLAEINPDDYDDLTADSLNGEDFIYVERGKITSTGTIDIHSEILKPGVTHTYLLFLYIDKSPAVSGVDATGKSISATVSARAKQLHYTPLSDFSYTLGTSNAAGYVVLISYTGSDPVVVVPDTYTIDGTDYIVAFAWHPGTSTGTFSNNNVLTDVILPSNIYMTPGTGSFTSIYPGYLSYLFKNCTSLVNAPVIPNNVTNMGDAFFGCTSLVNAPVIPNNVTNMGGAFSGCTSLVNAPVIPSGVTNGGSLFRGCTNLAGTIKFESDGISSASNIFQNTTKSIIAVVPDGSTTYTTLNNNKPSNVAVVGY